VTGAFERWYLSTVDKLSNWGYRKGSIGSIIVIAFLIGSFPIILIIETFKKRI